MVFLRKGRKFGATTGNIILIVEAWGHCRPEQRITMRAIQKMAPLPHPRRHHELGHLTGSEIRAED
jgi:hypothetical protein